MKYVLTALLGFLLINGCSDAHSIKKNDSSLVELETLITEYYSIMSSRNWTVYREFFTDKAVLTTLWQDSTDTKLRLFTNTITEFVNQTENGPDSQPIFEEKPIKIDVRIEDNLASAWVRYKAKFGTENNLIEWKGNDVISFIKYNDTWYITSITYTAID